MKFVQQRPSGKDKDIPVFEFAFGIEELKLMLGVIQTARKNLIPYDGWKPIAHRLNNIRRELEKTLRDYNNS